MRTIALGTTSMQVTRIGLGTWAIGGTGWGGAWGPQDDRASVEVIRRAIEQGINWIDTAAVYGLGHSEEIVAQALRDLPRSRRPLIFTKCGVIPDANPYNRPQIVGKAASIRAELEASLRRLGVDCIDLYQMHWPAKDGTPLEEYWETLLALKREGKVRAVGLSNHDAEQLERAERVGHVDTLQPPFSAIRRSVAERELPWCLAHRTGVIVYSPMQAGLLTGTFSEQRAAALSADDWRSKDPEFSGAKLRQNLAFVEALRPIAQRHRATVSSIALAWVLAWPGVTGAIVGARAPAQLDDWLQAGELELSAEDQAEIREALTRTGAGAGPVAAT